MKPSPIYQDPIVTLSLKWNYLPNTQFMPEDYIDYPLEATCQALFFLFTSCLLALSTTFSVCSLCQVMKITTSSKAVHFKVKESTVIILWTTYNKCGAPDVVRNVILKLCQHL